jgi:ionotropic glutamate receptor
VDLEIETVTLPTGRWRLDTGRFHLRPDTSTLFTYVVKPMNHPLINSVYNIINSGDINLLAREDGFVTILFSASKKKNVDEL